MTHIPDGHLVDPILGDDGPDWTCFAQGCLDCVLGWRLGLRST